VSRLWDGRSFSFREEARKLLVDELMNPDRIFAGDNQNRKIQLPDFCLWQVWLQIGGYCDCFHCAGVLHDRGNALGREVIEPMCPGHSVHENPHGSFVIAWIAEIAASALSPSVA